MSFTPGNFDIYAQVEASALDVVAHVILKTLERQNKTKFTQNVGGTGGGVAIDVELVKLSIPTIRTLNLADRFKKGNTLATFQADAELKFTLTIFGVPIPITDTLTILIKALQIGVFNTPGGLPVGVALGFQQFDIDVGGLNRLRSLSTVLNILADFIALGIRTALTPLGLIPIPILQFADAFAKIGLMFDSTNGSPFLGTSQNGNALYLAADFSAANNTPGNIQRVQDILPPGGVLSLGTVVNQRLINQVIGTLLPRGDLTRNLNTAGVNFVVNSLSVRFGNPGSRPAFTSVAAAVSARIRTGKRGFFGRLLGGRSINILGVILLDLEAGVGRDPNTQLSVIDFEYALTARGRVAIQSVLAGVLTFALGPYIVIFLFLLTQLLNFAIDFFLPLKLKFDVSGGMLYVTIEQLAAQLGLGPVSLTAATLKVRLDVNGKGTFELDHFTRHQIQNSQVPIAVDYAQGSLLTRQEELFLGARPRVI